MTGDPLGPTLLALPAVVAALCLVAWWARRSGGRSLRRGAVAGELIALAGLVLAAVVRPSLHLPWSAEVLYCGLALLLFHHVALQLVALRPLRPRTGHPTATSPTIS